MLLIRQLLVAIDFHFCFQYSWIVLVYSTLSRLTLSLARDYEKSWSAKCRIYDSSWQQLLSMHNFNSK